MGRGLRFWSAVALGLCVAGTAAAQEKPVTLSWTAGSIGGGWYTQAAAMGELVREKAPHITIKSIPGGGVQNNPIVDKGETPLGWGLAPIVKAAYDGSDPFDRPYKKLRAIMSLGVVYAHFLVTKDSGITSVTDIFKGDKPIRLGVERVGVSDEWAFRKILGFYKTSYDAIKAKGGRVFHGGYAQLASLMSDRQIGFSYTHLGVPAASIIEVAVAREVRLLPVPADLEAYRVTDLGFLKSAIPAGAYPKITDKEVPAPAMANVVLVNADIPDSVVYSITKILNDNIDRVHKIHPSFADHKVSDSPKGVGVPLHPGALRYYQEKGILK